MTVLMGYPGRKGAAGVPQRILSLMPRHDRYIEPFLGSGVILATKRGASSSVAADLDPEVIAAHRSRPLPGVEYRVADAFELLPELNLTGRDLVYLDPPYHPSTRGGRYYRFEMYTDAAHMRLLSLCLTLKASVMLSGYRCELYDRMLTGWHREDFPGMTQRGVKTESVWCNFRPGESFHDTRFLGDNYRERERIKRKRNRWASRFAAMSAAERAVIWEALEGTRDPLAAAGGADVVIAAVIGASGDTGDHDGEDLTA